MKTGFVLGGENWDRYDFKTIIKSFVLLIWDTRKNKIYGDQDGETSCCSFSCPLTAWILYLFTSPTCMRMCLYLCITLLLS